MNLFMKKNWPILFFSGLLIIIIGIVIISNLISNQMESNPNMTFRFHLPRNLSESEIAGPPPIKGNIQVYHLAPQKTKINWTDVIKSGPYDIVVIGDSFTGFCNSGIYLVNRLSADNNLSVLNIYTSYNNFFDSSPVKATIYLTNNGFFKKVQTKMVILSSAERMNDMNDLLTTNLSMNKRISSIHNKKPNLIRKETESTIEEIDMKFKIIDNFFNNITTPIVKTKTRCLNLIFLPIFSQTIDGEIHSAKLSKPMFTHDKYSTTLLYHKSETDYNSFNTTDLAIEVNNKLNLLSTKLKKENISLVYLPGISSYTSHYSVIKNPKYPRNDGYYNTLKSLKKEYLFINSMDISDELLNEGYIDLHGVGDLAHWNWPLTEIIANKTQILIRSRFNS